MQVITPYLKKKKKKNTQNKTLRLSKCYQRSTLQKALASLSNTLDIRHKRVSLKETCEGSVRRARGCTATWMHIQVHNPQLDLSQTLQLHLSQSLDRHFNAFHAFYSTLM